ncbi:MAG TPA: hypothetical protein VNO75_12695 [Gemmatimonadaceae bacterium]|nr:hypothetical protein [Gemmatimonadaceae bacterium]
MIRGRDEPLAGGNVAPPAQRSLRGYALDPSLAHTLQSAPISEIVFRVPWEPLEPGPIGRYLEVIDYDPAAKCFYAPVNLDDPHLLAQDGMRPSEGTPQFHQQMCYAVAQTTISNFERALGRVTLWSPGPPLDAGQRYDDSHFVPRLRIYPHALREANAYYSPVKKALLFGYFAAPEGDQRAHVPGGMVFTALSHDIIAHETAHALLDGMHRRLNRATNPDMLAFHEAFADIVALFQHFTFPEILRYEISNTRGELRAQNLLGQLASEFGRATGNRGALRDFIGKVNDEGDWEPHKPSPLEYESTTEPHKRGAILVAAVFEAFVAIYNSRVADLMRLYTGGTGILAQGAVHPDLVNRLSEEASKAASHILTMCVRALDYCPPVDQTFGEYLRAVITADQDMFPDDPRNYRVAMVEAFRRRGLYPRDVRALSAENLRWRDPENDEYRPSEKLTSMLTMLREQASIQLYESSREKLFHQERATRLVIHDRLQDHFRDEPEGEQDAKFLGLDPKSSFQVHSVHFAARPAPSGVVIQLIAQLLQERTIRLDEKDPESGETRFEGGSTIIANLNTPAITYCIRKPVTSVTRRQRQQSFNLASSQAGLRATYFPVSDASEIREPFALLHRAVI